MITRNDHTIAGFHTLWLNLSTSAKSLAVHSPTLLLYEDSNIQRTDVAGSAARQRSGIEADRAREDGTDGEKRSQDEAESFVSWTREEGRLFRRAELGNILGTRFAFTEDGFLEGVVKSEGRHMVAQHRRHLAHAMGAGFLGDLLSGLEILCRGDPLGLVVIDHPAEDGRADRHPRSRRPDLLWQ